MFRHWVLLLALMPLAGAELRIGRGVVRVTPPPGMPMGGSYNIRLSTGVHDDLYCKALVLEKDGAKAGTVTCDLESVYRPTVEQAREIIGRTTGLRGDHVMITATHSHSGPEMNPLILEGAQGETARISKDYHAGLAAKIAEAVRLAEADLTPARAWAGRAEERSVSFNRRYVMKDGSVRMNPGQLNPDIVRSAGPIDPTLAAVYFDSPDGRPLATVANFALHVTTFGGSDFSADYPGILARLLAEAKGVDMMTVFVQGCSGNINQVDVTTKERQFGPAVAARTATILAADILKTYRTMHPVAVSKLTVRSRYVDLPVPHYSAAEAAKARAVIEKSRQPGKDGPKFLELVEAFRVTNLAEFHHGGPVHTEVQVIALGDELAWVGLPGEVFTELGMALRTASPFPNTVVSELANNMLNYIPDYKAYPEGSYEVTTARCTAGCGETLVNAAAALLVEVFQENRRTAVTVSDDKRR